MEESNAPKIAETRFHAISTVIFRISTLFVMIFNLIYYGIIPIKGLILDLIDPWAAFFDILLGIALLMPFIVLYRVAHTRFGAFFQLLNLVYWQVIPGNWLLREWEAYQRDFANTFIMAWIIWGILLFTALLGILNFFIETYRLYKHKRSICWGPLLPNFKAFWSSKLVKSPQNPKYLLLRGFFIVLYAFCLSVPGLMQYLTNAFQVPVTVTPLKYDITYNFWATPGIYSNYSQADQQKYHFGPRLYNDSVLDEFNEHKVNLDLTFGSLSYQDVATLKAWETECPDITYRIVLSPAGNLTTLFGIIKTATEILLECEQNGTLNGFKGFCFDIEGEPFYYSNAFRTFEESTAMWNMIFDYIDEKSAERGKTIDMECVSDPWVCYDIPFDGDDDIQRMRQENEYYPERFTMYAPMIYRCWYGYEQSDIPYGAEEKDSDPWDTSYAVYAALFSLQKAVPDEKVGFYIGITNTSCYGRDLAQNEPYTWPVDKPNTGLTNLERDILIAKHFNVSELTFFLAWNAIENNFSMGGVFDSYGIDFLDRVNETVNTHPPESFIIYYNQGDAETSEVMTDDWLYDMRRWDGIAEIIGLWVITIFLPVWLYRKQNFHQLK